MRKSSSTAGRAFLAIARLVSFVRHGSSLLIRYIAATARSNFGTKVPRHTQTCGAGICKAGHDEIVACACGFAVERRRRQRGVISNLQWTHSNLKYERPPEREAAEWANCSPTLRGQAVADSSISGCRPAALATSCADSDNSRTSGLSALSARTMATTRRHMDGRAMATFRR